MKLLLIVCVVVIALTIRLVISCIVGSNFFHSVSSRRISADELLFLNCLFNDWGDVDLDTPFDEIPKEEFRSCDTCTRYEQCGFCGFFGAGLCLPGSINGSDLGTINEEAEECEAQYWHYGLGGDVCNDNFRKIETKNSGQKVEFLSIAITQAAGAGRLENLTVEAIGFIVSAENEPGMLIAYGTGPFVVDEANSDYFTSITYDIYAIVFANVIEYEDANSDGLNITLNGQWNQADDTVRTVLSLKDDFGGFGDITVTADDRGNEFVVHTGTMVTQNPDNKFTIECTAGTGDFTWETIAVSPYEMKCDIRMEDWIYSAFCNNCSLALNSFIVAGQFLHDSRDGPNGTVVEGSFSIGSNAFFKWKTNAQVGKPYSDANTCAVVTSNILLENQTFEWDPSTAPNVIDTNWDPEMGIKPCEDCIAPEDRSPLQFSTATQSKVAAFTLGLVVLVLLFV